jgi:hypothetical protein
MKLNKFHYKPLIEDTYKINFKDYCAAMREEHTYGTEVELKAISECFDRPIEIYNENLKVVRALTRDNKDKEAIKLGTEPIIGGI